LSRGRRLPPRFSLQAVRVDEEGPLREVEARGLVLSIT